MSFLTQQQADLLVWMIHAGAAECVLVEVDGPSDALVGSNNESNQVVGGDVRELAGLELLRRDGQRLEVTNAGRQAYQQIQNPPRPKP